MSKEKRINDKDTACGCRKAQKKKNPRLNRVGGQAVLEGVMMKAGERTVTTCRKDDGSLVVYDSRFVSVRKKHKLLNIPILRGVVNFIEMMKLSIKTLGASAEALGLEEEDGKAENWLKKHLGISLTDLVMVFSVILGLALSVVLFIYLPTLSAEGIDYAMVNWLGMSAMGPNLIAVVEGVMKIVIFLVYLSLTSLMKDIKRTFMYHGAEHKSIACFESGDELTPENARRHRRFHPRCGTSFMFLMILLGIFAGMFVRNVFPQIAEIEPKLLGTLAYTGIKLAILPIVMGVGYEILMLAGKHDNIVTRIISAPGLWVQRITTKEPTEDMLEVAIVSIKCALRDDYPEFMEFYQQKGWKKPDTEVSTEESETENGADAPQMPIVDIAGTEQTESADNAPVCEEAEANAESADTVAERAEQTADSAEPRETVSDAALECADADTVAESADGQTTAQAQQVGELLTPPHYFGEKR